MTLFPRGSEDECENKEGETDDGDEEADDTAAVLEVLGGGPF